MYILLLRLVQVDNIADVRATTRRRHHSPSLLSLPPSSPSSPFPPTLLSLPLPHQRYPEARQVSRIN